MFIVLSKTKSATGGTSEVTLSLLLVKFWSYSLPDTTASFSIIPVPLILAVIVRVTESPTAKLPIVQTPLSGL